MNAEEGEWLGRHDHPLLNHVNLENVFQYVKKRDLLACRGVCQQWNEMTIPFTRSKFMVDIQLSNLFLNHSRKSEKVSTRNIEDFVTVFNKNRLGNPFAKFKLGPICSTGGIGQQFLTLCGETTKELHLEQHEVPFQVEDVSAILRSMKKLEKLTIPAMLDTDSGHVVELFPGSKPKLSSLQSFSLESDIPDSYEECCPTLIEEIITAGENISDLMLGDLSRVPAFATDDENEENIRSNSFRGLSVIEKLGRESSIRNLTLGGIRMKPHVELLRRMAVKPNGLKLKNLAFSMDYDEEDSDHFHLVELFKDSLEHLRILCSPCSSFINFPKMQKLRRLWLEISKDFDSSMVNLNKIFPILKELELCQGGRGQVYEEFLSQSDPCPTLKSLSLLPGLAGLHLRVHPFNHVITIFPRLTKLWLEVKVDGHEILREIWTRMTQLEFLSIWGKPQTLERMDSLITGISTETIPDILHVLKDLGKTTAELRRETILKLRDQYCRLPSIGNLTNLRRLELRVTGHGERDKNGLSFLSDVTGFLGLYSLTHLNHLVVRESKLSKTCGEILTTEMEVGLESWEFKTPEGKSIIPDRTF